MSAVPLRSVVPVKRFVQLREAQDILRREAEALREIASRLDERFCDAVDLIVNCDGKVIVSGIGKAGLIGQKIAATLCSTGTRAQFLHAAEAVHGDLGCLSSGDVVLLLSNSGETDEVCRLLPIFEQFQLPTVAVTSTEGNRLSLAATVTIPIGRVSEVDANGLAPSTSTTAMLAIGDALALVASRRRGFTSQQFAQFHPGGNLGLKLTRVQDVMRSADSVRVAIETASVRDVMTARAKPGRRTGAVMLVDADGRLVGLFTDSDLARLLEGRSDHQLDAPIRDVMTRQPLTITQGARLADVVDLLADRKLSELPVIDESGCPVGLIDITDVIALLPAHDMAG